MATAPKISSIVKVGSIAGHTNLRVNVSYPGEDAKTYHFFGIFGIEGGTVFMGDIRVDNPERFGPFGFKWVMNFFS